MVVIVNQDTTQLDTLEDEAQRYFINAVENMQSFLAIVDEIYGGNLWKQKRGNWDSYCRDFLPRGASRIRQMKGANKVAQLINSIAGILPLEKEVKYLKAVIPDEHRHFMPTVYKYAHQLNGGIPARRHIAAAYEVELELSNTGAVSIEGDSVPPTTALRTAAHKEAIVEIDKRYHQHRYGNNPREKITGIPHAIQDVKTGLWYAALPLASHAVIIGKQTTFYIDKGKDNDT